MTTNPSEPKAKTWIEAEFQDSMDEELELECPACSETFTVTKKACQDYVQCPMCGKKGSLGDVKEEEEVKPEEHLLECPGCKKTMRIPGNVVPNETLIECPYCGARGNIG